MAIFSSQRNHQAGKDWFKKSDILDFYSRYEVEYLTDLRAYFIELAIALCNSTKPLHILDIGCGNGSGLQYISSHYPSFSLAGLDPTEDLLAKARARLSQNVPLLHCGIDSLPCNHNLKQADLILSYSNFRFWDDPERGIQAIQSLLTGKGIAFILDLRRDAPKHVLSNLIDAHNSVQDKAYIQSQIGASYTVDEVEEIFNNVGLMNYKVNPGGTGEFSAQHPNFLALLQHHPLLIDALQRMKNVKTYTPTSSESVMYIYFGKK